MIKVAIIDSGIDLSHKELLSVRKLDGRQFIPTNEGIFESDECVDDNGHGTAIAGIIHSHAPKATLLPVKVLDSQLRSRGDFLAKAIYWAIDQGADIINISADTNGAKFKLEIEKTVNYAIDKGALIVSSYGRYGQSSLPACLENVVSVDGDFIGDLDQFITCPNGTPDFIAPGAQQIILHINNDYNFGGGSSFAAAHISGQAASLALETNLKSSDLLSLLKQKGIMQDSDAAKQLLSSSQPFALTPDENIVKKHSKIFIPVLQEIQKCSDIIIDLNTNLLVPGIMRRLEIWPAILKIQKRLDFIYPREKFKAGDLITPYNLGLLILSLTK